MKITKQIKYLTTNDFFTLYLKFIKDTTKGIRTKQDGKRIRNSTIDNYNYVLKQLKDFVSHTSFELRIYLINNLNNKDKEQAIKYNKKFFIEFTDYLYVKKDLFDNYVGSIIKGIRTFYNYLSAELYMQVGDFHKKFHVPVEEVPIIVLTPEQLNYLIYSETLSLQLPDRLCKIKDIFVFGCTVALRFSDLMHLKKDNLHLYNNAYYLKVASLKTNTLTTIKLPEYAVDILKKYHKKQNTLLPHHSNSWLNKRLKELAQYLNFQEPIIKYRTKRGLKHVIYKNKEKREHYTLADHITTHTMRRTAITTMLRLGMPEQVVRKISGHSNNSKKFYRYVEFVQSYIDEHTDLMFEKLNKMETQKSLFA